MNDYKILAKDYDYINPKKEIFKQERFFRKLIKQYKVKTCLDSACGTGWHLELFEQIGLECSGSNLSKEMLAAARKNLRRTSVQLKLGDFRNLAAPWKQKFDMVACLTTSLPHMLTDRDAIAALRSMYNRLNKGGILVISNGITDRLLSKKPKFLPARAHKDMAFYFFFEYPDKKSIIYNILQVKKTNKGFVHATDMMEYNAMGQVAMQRYFSRTRFKKVSYFGNYDFSKYSKKSSPRMIVVAQK